MSRKGLAPKSHPLIYSPRVRSFEIRRGSGGNSGGEESTAGLHQNAKISFNKGKVWERGGGGEVDSKGFELRQCRSPSTPLFVSGEMY